MECESLPHRIVSASDQCSDLIRCYITKDWSVHIPDKMLACSNDRDEYLIQN